MISYNVSTTPQNVASWVPARALIVNNGTVPIYLGSASVTPATGDEVGAGKAIEVNIQQTTGAYGADLYAVSKTGTASTEVETSAHGRDWGTYLRSVVAAHPTYGDGMPPELLRGSTLDEVLDSLGRLNLAIFTTAHKQIERVA